VASTMPSANVALFCGRQAKALKWRNEREDERVANIERKSSGCVGVQAYQK